MGCPWTAQGNIWATTGNGDPGTFGYQESVLRLRLTGGVALADWWAPADWSALDAADLDLGSSEPLLLPGGLVFAIGKDGVGYLLDSSSLGTTGADTGLPGHRLRRQLRWRHLRRRRHLRHLHRRDPRALAGRAGEDVHAARELARDLGGDRSSDRRGWPDLVCRLARRHAVRARPGHRQRHVLARTSGASTTSPRPAPAEVCCSSPTRTA